MVFQKKSGFGFNGYQIPAMARGTRSARGRRLFRDNVEENKMCAFELLATVAGKLLLERENSLPPVSPTYRGSTSPAVKARVVKEELQDKVKPIKVEPCYQASSDEATLTFDQKLVPKEYSQQAASSIAAKPEELSEKHQGRPSGSPGSAESLKAKVEEGIETPMQFKKQRSGDLFCSEDHPILGLDAKPPSLVSSDSSAEIPPYPSKHNSRSCSLPRSRDGKGLVDPDDDENSSGCTHPSTLSPKIYRSHCDGDGRVRKFSVSKFWKVGPTLLRNESEEKPVFRSRKMFYTRQRTQRFSFKRRRSFKRGSSPFSFLGVYGEAISKSSEKGLLKRETSDSTTNCCSGEKKLPVKSDDYKVKLRIKSFKVPELFVEMPETATVGTLKRTVLETLTSMLGNGLRVGVILQGKIIRDDSKTLLHTGISKEDKLDLGFTLEPNPSSAPSQLPGSEESHFLEPCDSPKPLARLPAFPPPEWKVAEENPRPQGSQVESEHRSFRPHHAKAPGSEEAASDSKALVPAAGSSGEAMAMVSSPRKPRRTEMAQRRIRRPFSVAEVEALVTAVECLGTGRWRDVKIRAFENAKHRTYVDLKDKWKTLVHTARISPQQRRGEPVPQEFLDRVLQAHAYWSKQQAKLQAKPPPAQLLALTPTELPLRQ